MIGSEGASTFKAEVKKNFPPVEIRVFGSEKLFDGFHLRDFLYGKLEPFPSNLQFRYWNTCGKQGESSSSVLALFKLEESSDSRKVCISMKAL